MLLASHPNFCAQFPYLYNGYNIRPLYVTIVSIKYLEAGETPRLWSQLAGTQAQVSSSVNWVYYLTSLGLNFYLGKM